MEEVLINFDKYRGQWCSMRGGTLPIAGLLCPKKTDNLHCNTESSTKVGLPSLGILP